MSFLRVGSFVLLFAGVIFGQPAPSISGCPSFPANNIWNTAIDTLPVHPHSADYVSSVSSTGGIRYDTTMPINIVPGTQPGVRINLAYPPESDAGPYPIPPNVQVEPGDLHILLVDKDNCILYETFNSVQQPDGSWNVDSAAKWDLRSNALRPSGWTSADAAGLPITPGVLRYEEVAAGQIDHALRMTVPSTQAYVWQWPARHYASHDTSVTLPMMGQRFRLKAGFDISGFSPNMQVVLRAIKKYGLMVADNGLPWSLQADNDPRWDPTDLLTLRSVVGSNMEAVDVSGLMIDPDSGAAAQPGTNAALSAVTVSPSTVAGGSNIGVTLTLTSGAPATGALVTLTGSGPAFPAATVTVGAGLTVQTFSVPTAVAGAPATVIITASYNGASIAAPPLTVTPPLINSCPAFPANNIWNTRVDSLPVHPNSAAYINSVSATGGIRYDTTMPINLVPGTQPKVPIVFPDPSESDPGPYPFPPNAQVEQGSDQHVIVIDTDNCILYETFNSVLQPDGSWTADSGATWSLQSNALRPAGWTSADAAGLPIMPGVLRYAEMASGQIDHALRFTAPSTQRLYVWPGRHFASESTDPTLPPMGQRFRLKAGFNISGYSANMQVVLRAIQKYGLMLADNGLAWSLQADPDPRWSVSELLTLRQVLGSNMEAVDVSGLIVDPNSGQAVSPAQPAALAGVTVSPNSVVGGGNVSVTVALTTPAPSGGALVMLSGSSPAVPSAPITVGGGLAQQTFSLPTAAVNAAAQVTVTASYNGSSVVSLPFTVMPGTPDLTVMLAHTGSFTQGQTGTYAITVSNVGAGPTNAPVSVADALPAGLAAASIGGSGWACGQPSGPCTRSDALAVGVSYPSLTLTVNVAANAPPGVTNTATVSGGGETNTSNDTANDPTAINPGGAPAWLISGTHNGSFVQGQTGAIYTITVANNGTAPASGTATVTDTLPAGLAATAMSGTGWSCTIPSCTRSDILAANASYPPVTVTVNVASNAPSQVTNQVSVSGCGAPAANASDPTNVAAAAPAGPGWPINGGTWTRRKAITVAHTQVSGSASLVNFPMLFSSADPDFRTVPNGGSVGRADGKDIFFTDANGVKLNHELESYDGAAGKVVAWVQVPAISSGADVVLYVYFGNPASGDQQNIGAAWDAGYKGVWHLGNPSALSLNDSSSNGNSLTNHSASPAAGPIDGGVSLDGNDQYVSTSIDGTAWSQFTVEYWVDSAGTPAGPVGQFQWAAPDTPISGAPLLLVAHHPDNNLWMYFDGDFRATWPLASLVWHHIAVTWNSSHVVTLYVDGLNRGSYTSAAAPVYQSNANVAYFGTGYYGAYSGKEGEGRLSNVARSADWVLTEYHSQNSPVTFYGLGASQSGQSGGAPDLVIAAAHSGNFTQGQAGAVYSITVTNSGTAATSGTVTVADAVPAGLTAAAISGTGWNCTLATVSCNRFDTLAAGASYPVVTVKVNVAANAPAGVIDTATVSGGGETNTANDTANDPTSINSAGAPAWKVTATHNGTFVQGQASATYTIGISNNGTAATSGSVTVTDTLPVSLAATAMAGTGWSCTLASCTRGDALVAGGAYPPITLTVNVAPNAPSQVINQVAVTGGGAAAANASDPTAVTATGGSGWSINGGAWAKRKPITIAHTQVSGSSPLANFPMLFSSTDPDFRTTANGGAVGRADGKDIFFTDANGVKLNHELQSYDGTAGKVIAWVQVPSISPGADTLIYAYFGNAASGDQQNIASTWDSGYKGVWHLGNGSTLSLTDSSSNGNTLVNHSAAPVAGPIAGAVNLSGNDQYVYANLDGTSWSQFAIEYWVYSAGTPPYGPEGQFQWARANTPIAGDPFLLVAQDPDSKIDLYFDGDHRVTYPLTNFAWHHVAVTWNASHVATLYVDGIGRGSYTSAAATVYEPNANVVYYGTGYYATYNGQEGECRLSNVARSADWVHTEYNSQSAPGTFYSLGRSQ